MKLPRGQEKVKKKKGTSSEELREEEERGDLGNGKSLNSQVTKLDWPEEFRFILLPSVGPRVSE